MNFYDVCLKLATKAYKQKEIPVGAVVVINNKIIGKGYNKRINTHCVDNHAEIIAIKKAAKKLKDWRLSECDLYVTLKPCDMCMAYIKESRIKNVYYLADKSDSKKGFNKTNVICEEKSYQQLNSDYLELLSSFFKENCKR